MRRHLQLVLALGLALPLAAQRPPAIALVHGRILDGNGGAPLEDGTLLLRGDRIAAVGAATAVTVPAGARLVDARGRTVMPGLADAHVHLLGGWDGLSVDALGFRHFLPALLYAGVTTVLDMGNVLAFVSQLRQETAAGRLPGPRIHLVGPVVDGGKPAWPDISYAVVNPEQIPHYLRQLKAARVDVVKGYGGLSTELLQALVTQAARDSLRVFVDAWNRNGTLEVARTGIAAFAHAGGQPMSPEAIAYMSEHGVASITTLAVMESGSRRRFADPSFLDHPLLAHTLPPWYREELRAYASARPTGPDSARAAAGIQRLRVAMANVKRMFDAGILLAAGTDAPYPGDYYGEGLHRELELLVEAGLTPLQAITLATRNLARLLREEREWGTLEPGRRADVLVVRGNPAAHIGDTRNVELVIQAGRLVDRTALRFDPRKDPGYRIAGPVQAR